MFFNKSTLALAFVALANIVYAGQTPACLLSVIGASSNPADLATLCGSDAKNLESQISDKCGDKTQSALKFFANTCTANGHKLEIANVSTSTNTSSGFVTATATSGSSATGTGSSASASSTGSSSGSSASGGASSTASGSSSAPTATTNAAAGLQFHGTAFAAVVFVGAAALL
ncbi:Period circadian protein [Penicillium canariense]|uniref:Period circadian protein n=1 Tax=Penicillium canariense TaxID=189055 RepID=A0A9W9LUX9_9EURO|nr:Period circadian protein [Penicillium canariense]KAJ5176342.1 Period circadian protein [Penicillium canariense]